MIISNISKFHIENRKQYFKIPRLFPCFIILFYCAAIRTRPDNVYNALYDMAT